MQLRQGLRSAQANEQPEQAARDSCPHEGRSKDTPPKASLATSVVTSLT